MTNAALRPARGAWPPAIQPRFRRGTEQGGRLTATAPTRMQRESWCATISGRNAMQPDPSPISPAALCASAATSVRLTAHQTAFCAALSKRLPELNLTERERGIIDRIEARIQSDVWSPSIIDKMAELWGLSAQRIGERIGVSKNAVLGKTHRLFKAGDLRFPPKTLTTIRPASNRDP